MTDHTAESDDDVGSSAGGVAAASWTEALGDDDRGFVRNKGWEAPADLLCSYRNLERKIGANTVRVPGPGAGPKEVVEFWSTLGRPEAPEGYEFPAPDDVPGYAPELADWFRKAAHAVHMPAEMAQGLHDKYIERYLEDAAELDLDSWRQAQTAEAELRRDWGPAFDHRRQLANRAIRALGGDRLFEELQATGMANSASLARAFAAVGERLYAEDRFLDGGEAKGFNRSPDVAQREIRRLRADPDFMTVYGDRRNSGHQAAQERMDQLYATARTDD